MSAKVHNYYMKLKDKSTHLLILRALAWDANHEGMSTLSIHNLAESCARSDRAIQTALRNLETDGKLGIKYQDGHKTKDGKTNRYFLNDYRTSVDLQPVITVSPYASKPVPKPSPRAGSSVEGVKFSALGGEDSFTHTNTKQQNILNTNTVSDNLDFNVVYTQTPFEEDILQIPTFALPVEEENESAMHVSSPTDKSAGDIDLKPTTTPIITPQPEECSSDKTKKDFLREKDLIFPSDIHSPEDQQTAFKMLVQNNISQEQWQVIFDEFEGKTIWKHKRGEQIPSKMGYLYGMIKKAAQGQFNPESAKWIAESRAKESEKKKSLVQKTNELANRGVKSTKGEMKTSLNPQTDAFISEMNKATNKEQLQRVYFDAIKSKINPSNKDYLANLFAKRTMEIRT